MKHIALKEWEVAVCAMEQGRQDVIFRKGGILEPSGDFQMAHDRFLLYPAHEHQKPNLVRPEHQDLFAGLKGGFQKHIRSIAEVTRIHKIRNGEEAEKFRDRHIWTEQFIANRLEYKPERPLFVVELKISRLPEPIIFTETTEQAGCKSWVEVESSFDPFAVAGGIS